MEKCSLCGETNIYYKKKDENLRNSQTYENDNIQILADRLLKFEGYERTTNINYPVWICEECRKSLESFGKLLKIIKKGREKLKDDYYQENINRDDNDFLDPNHSQQNSEITGNILSSGSVNNNNIVNINGTEEPLNEPPVKRFRRPPKRFLDNNVYIPPKPIKIQIKQTNNSFNSSEALLPKIALIRLSTGRVIGQLMEADNYGISSRFRITCTICNIGFCFEMEFRKHLKNHKEEFENSLEGSTEKFLYDCGICQKSFQEHYAVRRHYKHAHSPEKPYQCAHCTARFKYKFNYDYHLAKHLNKKNFQCPVCTKKFILRYELLIHQRTHTKEKPYKCQFCSISFAHRSNLVTHRRLHTQKKTLKCSMCQATFRSLVYLKKHEKNHTKSKENLWQTSSSFYRLAGEEENNEIHASNNCLNIALPNFDTLQSTLMSARLNNNHINNSSSILNVSNEDIDVSPNQDQETTSNGLHGLRFGKTLSSSNDNILAKKTNDNYNHTTLSKGAALKSQTQILQKHQKMNEHSIFRNTPVTKMAHYKQQNMEKSVQLVYKNNGNLTNFENSPKSSLLKTEVNSKANQPKSSLLNNSTTNKRDFNFIQSNVINFDNSTISGNLKKQENFQNSLENNINTLNSKEIQNDMLDFVNFNNSTNSPKATPLMKTPPYENKLYFSDIPTTNHYINGISYTNLMDSDSSTKSPNFQNQDNQENILNTFTDSDSSYNLNDFCKLKNCPKKSTLLKTAENQNILDIAGNICSYDSFSQSNMTNIKNSTNTKDTILNGAYNIQNPKEFNSFLNLANSPKKISLLKIKENPVLNNFNTKSPNNSVNPLSPPLICLPKINMKSFKIVKISGDYLKTKFKTGDLNLNSPLALDKTVLPDSSISQMPKLKYFSNTNKLLKISPSNLATNEIHQPESCHNSPPRRQTNAEILNINSTILNGEFSKVQTSEHNPPLNLMATTNLKEIKIQNSINLSNNLSSITKDPIKFKAVKISQPMKMVKISTLNGSLNFPLRNNTNMKSRPAQEISTYQDSFLNSTQVKENSLFQKSVGNNAKELMESNSKPIKILNIKYLKNSSIDFNSSKKIPIQIITKSKDLDNITATTTNSPSPPLNCNSLVSLRKIPVKLQNSPNFPNSTQQVATGPVISLLKPKIISNATTKSSQPPLITNIEILAPLKLPLKTPPQQSRPTTKHPQNLLKQLDAYKFQCHYCWKYFKQKSALNRHLRTHTGEKPYKCNLCHKSYADASNYKKHKIVHKNAAEALNISRPPQVSPGQLSGGLYKHSHSPTHSTASDPDPDGIEIMKTIQKFGCSSSDSTEANYDIDSLSSSSMESYMWQQALGYAMKNDEIRDRIISNFSGINNSIMPADMEPLLNETLTNTFTCEGPD